MKKLLILAISLSALLVSCGSQGGSNEGDKSAQTKTETALTVQIPEGGVGVVYFHTKQRCITCRAIETETIAALKELNNDKVKLTIVDLSTEAGEPLGDKYKVAFSSLVLDNGTKTEDLTKMAFRYARNTPDTFKEMLKDEVLKYI